LVFEYDDVRAHARSEGESEVGRPFGDGGGDVLRAGDVNIDADIGARARQRFECVQNVLTQPASTAAGEQCCAEVFFQQADLAADGAGC
jgi:hypothetical protein